MLHTYLQGQEGYGTHLPSVIGNFMHAIAIRDKPGNSMIFYLAVKMHSLYYTLHTQQ